VLEHGKIVEQGAVFDVFSNPQTDTARRFISTVIRNQPSDNDLDRLQKAHTGRIVNVEIHESLRIGSILSHAFSDHGVQFEVVYGGIGAIQERSFGSLTLELDGPEASVDALIAQLGSVTTVEEVRA
jgi:D-methionine transport system ATP-binding protein